MVSLNMIDTQGGGIKRMFQAQLRRFFPLPDYDLSQPERVMVTLRGRILDVRYTRLLMAQGERDLATIMLLDKVQKGQRIAAADAKRLKAAKLVEGRYPNQSRQTVYASAREPDALTGYDELVVRSVEVANGDFKSGQASSKVVK